MDTSGTGHDRCPSPGPGPCGARTPPSGGVKKISKVVFGFKRGAKIFLDAWRRSSDVTLAIRFINKILRRGALRDPTVCWAGAADLTSTQLVSDPRGAGVVRTQPSSENRAYRGPPVGSCRRVRFRRRGGPVIPVLDSLGNGRRGRAECPACHACYEFRIQVAVN